MTTLIALQAAAADSSGDSLISRFADWSVHLMEVIGAPGAALAIALENLFPPLPSEVILPLAGFAASRGSFSLFEALLWTTIGSIVGAYALYWVGRALGRERTRAIFGWLPLVDLNDVDKVEAWFDRNGSKAVFFGRMIPIFRSLISIPAGITKMNQAKFLGLTAAGSLIWNSIFVLSGYYLGENWKVVEDYADVFQKIVIVVVLALLVLWLVLKIRKARAKKAGMQGTDSAQ
ncbi:DedA family protein [Paeniglutamicibacter gangotriensis]|uniref:Alkaline phosphatase n=1 Tax=Paeniglutamicibacter gangotriensis Lz1y TaxID=1276920 RepID=M7MXW8_9MICC|nr:DedA family protein [Paeniglutamicibacter gangotriensis]EMQ99785.1 alkaline phosphatase [Paeniglutamicibacter gangotriensis Lz1y]